jgi:hypothetical protein
MPRIERLWKKTGWSIGMLGRTTQRPRHGQTKTEACLYPNPQKVAI